MERIATADVAAQAAYKRLNLGAKQETATQRNIRLRAMKELEEERRAREMESNRHSASNETHSVEKHVGEIDVKEFEHSNAIKGVFFTCELLGDDIILTKEEVH
uniref:IBB domain-containing protein n=1 Tax=Ascaris lumbricoides TaxID=6252 RepID=A0A0M3HHM2_ASCLU